MAQENALPLASEDNEESCAQVNAPVRSRLPGIITNAILIDIGWAACVFGAASAYPLVGPGIVALLVAIHWGVNRPCHAELSLLALVTAGGFLIDSALTAAGLFAFGAERAWLAPLWLVALWLNLATAINWCLGWMKGRLVWQVLFGGIVGPFAYFMGARLGALEFPQPLGLTLLVLAIVWAMVFPAIYLVNDLLQSRIGREALLRNVNR
jgi:hypothetical protein